MTDSSGQTGLLYDHQYSYYYALTPFTLGISKSLFFLKIDYCLVKLDFSRLSFPDVTVTVAQTYWAAVSSEAAMEAGGSERGRFTDRLETQTGERASVRVTTWLTTRHLLAR